MAGDSVRFELERSVIRTYGGSTLVGSTQSGEPAIVIPLERAGLPRTHAAHQERVVRSAAGVGGHADYDSWLAGVPYVFAQRCVRARLRSRVRAMNNDSPGAPLRPCAPVTVVMADYRMDPARLPHRYGVDVLVRRPLTPDAGAGRQHRLRAGTNKLLVAVHGSFRDFAHTSGLTDVYVRFICSRHLARALKGSMRAHWLSRRLAIEALLGRAEWEQATDSLLELLVTMFDQHYCAELVES